MDVYGVDAEPGGIAVSTNGAPAQIHPSSFMFDLVSRPAVVVIEKAHMRPRKDAPVELWAQEDLEKFDRLAVERGCKIRLFNQSKSSQIRERHLGKSLFDYNSPAGRKEDRERKARTAEILAREAVLVNDKSKPRWKEWKKFTTNPPSFQMKTKPLFERLNLWMNAQRTATHVWRGDADKHWEWVSSRLREASLPADTLLAFELTTPKRAERCKTFKQRTVIMGVAYAVFGEEMGQRLPEAVGVEKTIRFTKDYILGMHNNGARGRGNGYIGRAALYHDRIPALKSRGWSNSRIEKAVTGLIAYFDSLVPERG